MHMCKIDTFDPESHNRHKQNQELGWSSCIMNVFRKLFQFWTFQGETWKINCDTNFWREHQLGMWSSSFRETFARFFRASYYTRRLKFVDVYQIWWRICLSRFKKRSKAREMMKIRPELKDSRYWNFKIKELFCVYSRSHFPRYFFCFCIIPSNREFIDSSRSLGNVVFGNFFLAFYLQAILW